MTGFRLGELARLLDVDVRRVEYWARAGWLQATGGGEGPGHRQTFAPAELEIARRVLRHAAEYGYQPNEIAFARIRTRVTEDARR